MNCKYCGSIANPTDRFCGVCGKPIEPINQVTTNNQYSNASQFNNVRQNVNSFDSYNYNPNRYNPARQTNEVNQSQQVVFAHSIAISLLVVMLIIFIIVALIYYSSDHAVAEVANNNSSSNVVVYQPTYQNKTTTNSSSSSRYTSAANFDSVYSADYDYEVEYGIPSTFSSYGTPTDTQKFYYNSAKNNIACANVIHSTLDVMIQAMKAQGYTINVQEQKNVSGFTYLHVQAFLSSDNRTDEYYIYQIAPTYVYALYIAPANTLTTSELNAFLNISIY